MSTELGVCSVHMKDEAERLGLGSFKALGGAYAVVCPAVEELGRQLQRVVARDVVVERLKSPMEPVLRIFKSREWRARSTSATLNPSSTGHSVRRLMTKTGLAPIYQHPKTNEPHPQHKIYPYLLRYLIIEAPNHV